jgi:hypothetical protein
VLAPSRYWQRHLNAQVEDLVNQKSVKSGAMRLNDNNIVVSLTERSQRDLAKRFPKTKIGWAIVDKELEAWGKYFQKGKKLRVNLSFNYVILGGPWINDSRKRGDKRGSTSVTKRMLAELDLRLDIEQATSGQPSIWRHVYNLMGCPGPPYHLGPHCWIDPKDKTLKLKI